MLPLFLLLAALAAFTNAQPQPCGGPAFAKVGTRFYIQGGATSGDNLLQYFWALDLTTSWTTSNPNWEALPLGPPNAYHSAGYSADNNSFITFGRDTGADPQIIPQNFVNAYDIPSKTWNYATNPSTVVDNSRRDFFVVSDPNANKIYVLGGNAGPAGAISSNAFDVYDPITRATTEIQVPAPGPQSISTYTAAWIQRLDAMLVVGGYSPKAPPLQGVYLYHPSTGSWTTQVTTGTFNYATYSHCAASNADGTLVVVMGGFTKSPGIGEATISILDTTTWIWTTLPYPGRGRGSAACTIIEDTYMFWGGLYNAPNTVKGVPAGAEALILFSITKRTWLTTYTPSDALARLGNVTNGGGNPGGSSPSNSTSSGLSTGAIGGIIAGGVALLAVAIFTLIDRRRRKRKYLGEKPFDPAGGVISGFPDAPPSHHHQIAPPRPPLPKPMVQVQYPPQRPTSTAHLNPRQSMQSLDASNSSRFSNPTTPSTMYFVPANEPIPELPHAAAGGMMAGAAVAAGAAGSVGGAPLRYSGRQSYPAEVITPAYFPPPPQPTMVQQQPGTFDQEYYRNSFATSNSSVDRRGNDPQILPGSNVGHGNGSVASPMGTVGQYQAGISTATTIVPPSPGTDMYYDSLRKHDSFVSSHSGQTETSPYVGNRPFDPRGSSPAMTGAPMIPQRPPSGPQGGLGYGSTLNYPAQAMPGAPQAILQHQPSVRPQPYQPPVSTMPR
ncbi:hypothetical protein BGX31_010241 [Mortierella sp. GBA43]|nr:hypothetical protein BGX31_010241 [Mortierella sp. GBA43]